jgi:hypothetical protein
MVTRTRIKARSAAHRRRRGRPGADHRRVGGIGAELAREFARHGHRLTLVARRKDKLVALAKELESAFHVDVELIVQDLAKPTGPAAVVKAARAGGRGDRHPGQQRRRDRRRPVRGELDREAGRHGQPERARPDRADQPAAAADGGAALRPDPQRRSLAAFQPVPSMAAYAASKAYVLALERALAESSRAAASR